MSVRLITGLIGAVVIGGPILALNFVALGRQAAFETAIDGETAVPGPIAAIGQRADSIFGDLREGREVDVLFDADALTRKRVVRFVSEISIADVLTDGEDVPDPEFHKLFLEARAPQYVMQQECPLLLETMAVRCATARTEIDQRRDGTYRLVASLAYAPDHELGAMPAEGPTDLYRVNVALSRDRLMTEIPVTEVAEIKELFIGDALKACADLREERGNCAIRTIEFSSYSVPDRPDMAKVAASASLAWVGPRADGVDNSILKNVTAATPEEAAERASLFARVTGALTGDSDEADDAAPSKGAPTVLRGGNAFRGASDGNFITAPD